MFAKTEQSVFHGQHSVDASVAPSGETLHAVESGEEFQLLRCFPLHLKLVERFEHSH